MMPRLSAAFRIPPGPLVFAKDPPKPLMQKLFRSFILRVASLPLLLLAFSQGAVSAEDLDEGQQFFRDEVLPILRDNCFECHAGEEENGGLQLDSRARLLLGGDLGPAVDLEDPEYSELLQAIRWESLEMPPGGKLDDGAIAIIERWVALGAPYPEEMQGDMSLLEETGERGMQITDEDRAFWAFQPPARVTPPVDPENRPGNPIDAFIAARQREAGLTPNGPADPRHLIRRLHYDLTGLPPSQELVEQFVDDPSEEHYRQIVDRLLASPEYGEQWGRHYLDLVRYAETNSYERDGAKPEVWRYRDYVIQSLNSDKPYDEFVREQLAGDEMPFTPERMIATGFYRLGIWDDEPADPEQALYDDLDDIVAVTSQVFLGLTINCARCHDHKIDPIRQKDYYQLTSFFAGLNRFGVRSAESIEEYSLRPLLPPDQRQQHTEAAKRFRQQQRHVQATIRKIEEKVRDDLAPVEKEDFQYEVNRTRLVKKRVGSVLTQQEFDDYVAAKEELRELERDEPLAVAQALVVTEVGPEPRDSHVLIRGSAHAPGDRVEPAFPAVLGGEQPEIPKSPNPNTAGRRRVLADWIASTENPMFARVAANRLWQYHFGRGIVATPNDFGYQGAPPTHPDLLDWLAQELVRYDWHFKPLHRVIVTSDAYRRSSAHESERWELDPENKLLWRFDPRRLTAEEIRDSMLALTGQLNLQKYGPSMYPIIEPAVLAGQSQPGSGWGESSQAERSRRSVYIHIKRSLAVPLLANFDAADTDFTCPVRFTTTQPTQALGMLNGDFVGSVAQDLAEFSRRRAGEDVREQVRRVLRRATHRDPSDQEIAWGTELIEKLQTQFGHSQADALKQFCVVVLSLNEFIYLD